MNLREFGLGPAVRLTIPHGGGDGCFCMVEPLWSGGICETQDETAKVVLMSPARAALKQAKLRKKPMTTGACLFAGDTRVLMRAEFRTS